MNSSSTPYGTIREYSPVTIELTKDASPDRSRVCALLGRVVLPTAMFTLISYIRMKEIHYWGSTSSLLTCILILLLCVAFCCTPVCKPIWQSQQVMVFWLLSIGTAWVSGLVSGDVNYNEHFRPYFDITNLNTYPHVDPSIYYAQQFLDAAVIDFVPGAHLDISKSIGFKNGDVYCVAPIVSPNNKTSKVPVVGKTAENYDFWAVGKNCCSGHGADFACGEYGNPKARKGLRLMEMQDRDYFLLAVQAAQASYNLVVHQPIFLHWMEFPEDEVYAYHEEGWKYFSHGIFMYLIFQILLTSCFAWFQLRYSPGSMWQQAAC